MVLKELIFNSLYFKRVWWSPKGETKCPSILSFFCLYQPHLFECPHILRKFFAFKKLEICGPKCNRFIKWWGHSKF